MSDYDLVMISVLPVALMVAGHYKQGELSGFDICMAAVVVSACLILSHMIDGGLVGILLAGIPALVLLPWALVPLPKTFAFGYDVWEIMNRVAETDSVPAVLTGKASDDPTDR